MRYYEIVNELFDKPVEFSDFIQETSKQISSYFSINEELTYKINFFDNSENCYEVMFKQLVNGQRNLGKMNIIGTGNQYTVFSTVIKIIEKFINEYKPNSLVFTADEPSRKKLYTKISHKLKPSDYTWKRTGPTVFILDREENLQELEIKKHLDNDFQSGMWDHPSDLKKYLRDKGFKDHSGNTGTAFIRDDLNYVIKIVPYVDKGYQKWIKECEQHQDNPYFMKILKPGKSIGKYIVYIIEKLEELSFNGPVYRDYCLFYLAMTLEHNELVMEPGGEINVDFYGKLLKQLKLSIDLDEFIDKVEEDREFTDKILQKIKNIMNPALLDAFKIISGKYRPKQLDLTLNNVMTRNKSQLVFIDILY